MAKTQVPGYYGMMLGDFEVTAISGGAVKLPVKDAQTNTTPDEDFVWVPVNDSSLK